MQLYRKKIPKAMFILLFRKDYGTIDNEEKL